jgi:hypothetical protein
MTNRNAASLAAGTRASFAMAAPPPNEDPHVGARFALSTAPATHVPSRAH